MRILFIHQNAPGQFRHLAPHLAQAGHDVVFLGKHRCALPSPVRSFAYPTPRDAGADTHRYLRRVGSCVRRGQSAARACVALAEQGFRPDLIIGHPGWGELMFLRDDFFDLMGNHQHVTVENGTTCCCLPATTSLFKAGGGNDYMESSGTGHDTLLGGAGNDTIIGSGSHNFLSAGNGADYLQGSTGSDTLLGGSGHDTLAAGSGHEMMMGGSGSTLFVAGDGNDTMISGSGADQFEFHSGGGQNVVMGWHDGDMIQIERGINGLDITNPAHVAAHVQDVHGSAVIQLGDETITLVGIKAEDIHNNPTGYFTIH